MFKGQRELPRIPAVKEQKTRPVKSVWWERVPSQGPLWTSQTVKVSSISFALPSPAFQTGIEQRDSGPNPNPRQEKL